MFLQGHKRRLHLLALSDTRFVILYGGGNASPSLAQLGSFRSAKELWVEKARFEFGPKRLDHFATATLSESLFVVSRSPPNPPSKGRPSLHVYCEGEVAMCYPHALLVIWRSPCEAAPATNRWPRVLKAATSKAGPMRQQDRILKRLQDGRAPSSRGLQGGEALLLSTDAAGNRITPTRICRWCMRMQRPKTRPRWWWVAWTTTGCSPSPHPRSWAMAQQRWEWRCARW
jgi:hypothetical protein